VTTTPDQRHTLSRRERARAATIDEIKQVATDLMRQYGSTEVRFTDIAREMGMTAPGLYRYFADRDELLTALITDAFDELGDLVAAARESVPADDIWGRFLAIARAYRDWARNEPVRFALILGMPVPGYVAPEDGPTTEAAIRAMTQLKAIFFEAAACGELRRPLLTTTDPAVQECVVAENEAHPDEPDVGELGAATFQAMLHCWSALHGFASLEAHGHLQWLPEEARDAIFEANARMTATAVGLPSPDSHPE
jgi:AcrR family transcriptional regulator